MDAAIASYIYQPSVITSLLAGIPAFAIAAAAGAMAIPKIAASFIPKPKHTRLGDHIKFKHMHADGRIVVCEDGMYAIVLQCLGTDLKFNERARQQQLNNARQVWLEQMNEMGIRVREFFVRDRLPKASDFSHNISVMDKVSKTWNAGLPQALSTEFFLVLTIKDEKNGVQRLNEAVSQTKSILIDYRCDELIDHAIVPQSLRDDDGEAYRLSERLTPAAFFGRMLSPITRPSPIGGNYNVPLSYKLSTDNVRFDEDLSMFEFSSGPIRKYAAVLVIEEWSTPQYETHMLDLLSYPIEMTICHDIAPIAKGPALATLRWQERMAPGLQPGSDAVEQYGTVAMALERGSEEEQELAAVQTSIVIYGDTPEEIEKSYRQILQIKILGITPVWPKHTMVQHWFSLFPGFDVMGRPQRLLSGEVAILSTFQATPAGSIRSDWGEGPIAMFETLDGSPYSFQWHVGDGSPPLGHCVSIGPSGSGKTTLITFLAAMSLRHSLVKAYFFDRGRGCEVITRALNGSYLFFDGDGDSVSLNPMQLDDNALNRQFLREWMELIANVGAEDYAMQKEIADAIEINFDRNLDIQNRNLQKLYGSAFPAGSELRQRLLAWTNPSQYGSIVCARRDSLDISTRLAGFDFTNVLTDERLGPAMVSYIMHRILAEAKGDPRLIFIDETEPLLRNENFRLRFKKLLQEGRKERQVIISCFQRPQAPEEVGVGDTIRGQCPTVFFFRNLQAEEKDYSDWRLTPRELDFVLGRTYRKNKYAVLVKRYSDNPESIILNTDLSALGPWMKIFHSGRQQVLLAERLQKEHGSDFLQHYLNVA